MCTNNNTKCPFDPSLGILLGQSNACFPTLKFSSFNFYWGLYLIMAMVMIMVFVLMLKESTWTNMLPMSTCHYTPMYALYCTVRTATHCNSPYVVHCIRCTALLGMNYGALPLCMLTCHSPLTFLLVTLAVIILITFRSDSIYLEYFFQDFFLRHTVSLRAQTIPEALAKFWWLVGSLNLELGYMVRKLRSIAFQRCIWRGGQQFAEMGENAEFLQKTS